MYYAFLGRPMVNGKGEDTSILFGFTKYLLELLEREKPTHVAVSFDPPGGTFRSEMYPAYKANRAETPSLVIEALQPLCEIVQSMGIPVLMIPGFEADDVIGSAAKRFRSEDTDVYMVTPDKDYGQLIESHIFQYRPGKAGAESEVLGVEQVCAKWGIDSPAQVIDILAICGDTADNVPGVAGVGPVGASKLLRMYGSVDGIYAHADSLSPAMRSKFEAARDHIALSRELVTIKTDIPLDVTLPRMELRGINTPAARALMDRHQMPSLRRLLERFPSSEGPAPSSAPEEKAAATGVPAYEKVTPEAFVQAKPARIAVCLYDGILYAAASGTVSSGPAAAFGRLLENPAVVKAGSSLKRLMNDLAQEGIALAGRLEDAELMHYLLNPERSHDAASLVKSYLGIDLESCGPEDAAGELSLFEVADTSDGADRCLEAAALLETASRLKDELKGTEDLWRLYDSVEEPLVGVLSRMELYGVRIDPSSLKEFADALRLRLAEHEAEVRRLCAAPSLNVASPKQIGEALFEKLRLEPKARKPRSGSWPTDEQTLQGLREKSPEQAGPVVDAILEYRGTRKLLSTYIDPLPACIRSDGRVHTTFNQALTSTGRLSSSNPNLQNIPVRTEQGREIRKAFVPSESGSVMMSADYSQIELRIMAHLCGDAHLCEAFRSGADVHSMTASRIFGVPLDEVTADRRRVAKTANFGIMYGISPFGLAQNLGCSASEAKSIIDDYFASFPSIRLWIESTLAFARQNGYVQTIFGRRRYVGDVVSSNGNLRAVAERNAVNAPIQGSSADIIKMAMIGVDRCLRERGLDSRMVLQIHDELLLEVPRREIETVRGILVKQMEGVVKLDVPLTVECNYGNTWLEAH